jgi:hypothetical protein
VGTPQPSGDQPRDIYHQRVHDLQTAFERLEVSRDQVKACQEHDGTLLAEKYGIDYRACKKWLELIHSVAKDLAIWEKADIEYNGRRKHDDDADDPSEIALDASDGEDEVAEGEADDGAENRLTN